FSRCWIGNFQCKFIKALKRLLLVCQEHFRILCGSASGGSSSTSPLAEVHCCIRVSRRQVTRWSSSIAAANAYTPYCTSTAAIPRSVPTARSIATRKTSSIDHVPHNHCRMKTGSVHHEMVHPGLCPFPERWWGVGTIAD